MFKNIILPQRLGNYYLFSQNRLGFDITKKKVRVTQVLAKGTKRIIKNIIEEPINQDQALSQEERTSQAIENVLRIVKRYDAIFTALPSSKVVFKEITLPFSDPDKIAAIIRFEVEPYLPFSVESAYIDFIITDQRDTETTVLVAAVKQEYIEEHRALFKAAGAEPEKITIDAFELFGVYKRITSYEARPKALCLIDLELYATRIIYIVDGKLVGARMLNKGIATLAATPEDLEQFYRFGIEQDTEIPQGFKNLLRDVQFTISSLASSAPREISATTLVLFGDGVAIKGITDIICRDTPYQCELFEMKRLLEDPSVSFDIKNSITPAYLISVATALSSPITERFNIMPRTAKEESLINKQLLAGAILTLLPFVGLGTHAFFQLRKLRAEFAASERQAIAQLRSALNVREQRLGLAVDSAKKEVERQEGIWFSLSPQKRTSFLKYLEELSTRIDREGVGLELNKLSITRDMITLEGSVRDYTALDVFQRELRQSQLFSLETPLQDPNFKVVRLIVHKNGED